MPTASLRRIACASILVLLSTVALAAPDARKPTEPIPFDPYKNESEVIGIGPDLTIENRLDRVTMIGSIDLTLDQEGIRKAEALRMLLDRVCRALRERKPLPPKVVTVSPTAIDNPFE
ncbi:MAG TPA: hypothetical protein VGK27_00675 [Candidatus Deferrimicrobiaceae bacterium]|jgi:hypothetical protein